MNLKTDQENRATDTKAHRFRFHLPIIRASSVFGDDWLSLKAEAFARFFGTPFFLLAQTGIVACWIAINVIGWASFDRYPFILLNLAFSLQAAYAAPLILLAQTRQADRDKLLVEADAQHREALAAAGEQRQILAGKQADQMLKLIEENTHLTEITKTLTENIELLAREIHANFVKSSR